MSLTLAGALTLNTREPCHHPPLVMPAQPANSQNQLCWQVSTSQEGVSARLGLLRPLLRIVANVAAFAGRDAATELLVPSTCKHLAPTALVWCAPHTMHMPCIERADKQLCCILLGWASRST